MNCLTDKFTQLDEARDAKLAQLRIPGAKGIAVSFLRGAAVGAIGGFTGTILIDTLVPGIAAAAFGRVVGGVLAAGGAVLLLPATYYGSIIVQMLYYDQTTYQKDIACAIEECLF